MKRILVGICGILIFGQIKADSQMSQNVHEYNVMPYDQPTGLLLGPFELSDKSGDNKIRIQFAGQLKMQYESRDNGADKGRDDKLFAEARRIRLTLTGKFPSHKLNFKLHLSTAPGSIELMDFYFDYQFRSQIQIRLGQYKVPFTRYRIQSFQRLTFVDWAIVTGYFGAERQMGLALHNGYEKSLRWGYAAGIFTGVNARASHAVGLAKIYGEKTENPSDLADPGSRAEFHPELFVHVSYNPRSMDVQSDTDEKREALRINATLSAAWDIDPVTYHDLYLRLSPEILAKYRGFSFSGLGYAGFVRMEKPSIVRLGMYGGLFQSAYRINDKYEISARYAVVQFKKALIDDAYERSRAIIARAEEDYEYSAAPDLAWRDLADITAQYKNAGQVGREAEGTMGINIYLEGHSLKWQNDIGCLIHTRRDETRTDIIARSQLQLTF